MNSLKQITVIAVTLVLALTGCKSSEEIRKELAPQISELNNEYTATLANGTAAITLQPKVEYKWGGSRGIKYSWHYVKYSGSGAGGHLILNPNDKNTEIRMYQAGTYQFKFRAEGDTIAWRNHSSEKIVNITVSETAAASLSSKSLSGSEHIAKNLPLVTGYDFSSSDLNDAWVWGTQNNSRWLSIRSLSDSSGFVSALSKVANSDFDRLIIDLTSTGYADAEQAELNAKRFAEQINVSAVYLQQHKDSVRHISLLAHGAGTEKERLQVVLLLSSETSAYGELFAHMILRDTSKTDPAILVGQSTLGSLQWLNYFDGSTQLGKLTPNSSNQTVGFEATVVKALSL